MNYPEKEFLATYNKYVDMIYRLCFSFLKNKEDTEDAVQSIFMKYLKSRKIEASVIIYNVNEKANVASLAEDDGRMLLDILEGCDRTEYIEGGLFQYVIKINDISYLFDSKGNGMISESANHQGIAISEEDMDVIIDFFIRYNISLEEVN